MSSDLFLAEQSFVPTRKAALQRLSDFVPRAGRVYAEKRNHDFGPTDRSNVSTLSPYIRHRVIHEREVIEAVLHRHAPSTAEKFVQEVFWRTYWKGWLKMRPGVWASYVRERDAALDLATKNNAVGRELARAEGGETGIDGFDDWARELVETGYLHNHARMWFASIWIFTLKLPWTLGADFFMRHLLDADSASNTLSWRWVAGLQTVGKTYQASRWNIEKYTDGRFSPDGLAATVHPLPADTIPAAMPVEPGQPLPAQESYLVLLTPDHAHFDPSVWPGAAAVAAVDWTFARSTRDIGEPAAHFTRSVLEYALEAARDTGIATLGLVEPADLSAILDDADLKDIALFRPTAGHARDAWMPMQDRLRAAGVAVHERLDPYDAMCWPHARKGFFAFKENIPDFLSRPAGFSG